MARYVETKVVMTANQAAGIDPVLAAESGTIGVRQAMLIGNPTATDWNLHLTTAQTHGTGMPLGAAAFLGIDQAAPGLNNALYVTGATTGDTIALWIA